MSAPLPFHLPPPSGGRVDVLIVAAEHSGDEHAARMVRELRAKQPGLAVAALGGPQLAAAGAGPLYGLTGGAGGRGGGGGEKISFFSGAVFPGGGVVRGAPAPARGFFRLSWVYFSVT